MFSYGLQHPLINMTCDHSNKISINFSFTDNLVQNAVTSELTDVEILVKECDPFTQLIQVKVRLDVCYLYIDL